MQPQSWTVEICKVLSDEKREVKFSSWSILPTCECHQSLMQPRHGRRCRYAKIARAQKSIFADIGGGSADSVVGASFTYDSVIGDYSFSLVNKLREPVQNVYCLIVFYDKQGTPLDVQVIRYSGVIPDGLAKRIAGRVDSSYSI
jgi:hypothetical protein